MFLGAIPRRPDKATAYRELKKHLTILGVAVAVIRATPYVLHYLSDNPFALSYPFYTASFCKNPELVVTEVDEMR
ncbi:Mitochondrial import receptor subunit TOM6-like protein [Nymphaea thermarum]|nr:Mitochondrial import receptor subunit TOM6-like protein [Nymphaea thermarum]